MRPIHTNEEAAFADGELTAMSRGDRDSEQFLLRFCARHGVNLDTAIEMMEEFDEYNALHTSSFPQEMLDFQQRVKNAISNLLKYTGDITQAKLCVSFALGFKDVIGDGEIKTIVDLSRYLLKLSGDESEFSKQRVNKCLKHFQLQAELPELDGQRNKAACDNMATAQKEKSKTYVK